MNLIFLLVLILFSCQERESFFYSVDSADYGIDDINTAFDVDININAYNCSKISVMLSESNDNTDVYLPDVLDEQFYLILLLQGADLPKENYKRVSTQICSCGFVVAVFDHFKEGFYGRHLYCEQNATKDIFYKLLKLSQENNSSLHGRVKKDRFILLGHSYGAGCGLFMIGNECKWPFCSDEYKRPFELLGGIFYGISLKSPFGETYYKIQNDNIPVLIIAGDNDGAIKYEYAEKTFDSILTPPKIFIRLKGANHYAINDSNPPPQADADKNVQFLDQGIGISIISKLTVLFIYEYILGNESFKGRFDNAIAEFNEYIDVKKVDLNGF